MDQLKVFLAQLKKHHFWVFTALVVLLSLTGWYLASSQLAEEYVTNKGKIEGEFNELRGIVSKTNHPNEKFEAGTNVLTTNLTKDVQQAWKLVYADQKAKVLKWPAALGEDFLAWMEAASPTDEIPIDYRDMYLNYVKAEFPRLLEIVDARPFWDREEEEAGGPGGTRRPRMQIEPGARRNRDRPIPKKKDYTVIWERKNQQEIDETLDFPEGIPDSTAVRFCQENLWVYYALLNAIAHVNEGATGNHNAKIKEIVSLSIGQAASALVLESLASGRIAGSFEQVGGMMPGMEPGMHPGMEVGGMAPGMTPGVTPGMIDGSGAPIPGETGTQKPSLDNNRYVDEKGMPQMSGTPGPAEFKRMPIVMRLVMDQREIAKLLVALADSPLPVEIRQLRVNTKMSGVLRPPHRQWGFGNEAGAVGGRGKAAEMRRDEAMEESLQYPYDVTVELQGIIYIFNPPDKSLDIANVGEAGADSPDGGVPAQPPADAASAPESAQPSSETATEPTADNAGATDSDAAVPETPPAPAGDSPAAAAEPNPEAPPAGLESGAEPAAEPEKKPASPPPDDVPFGA